MERAGAVFIGVVAVIASHILVECHPSNTFEISKLEISFSAAYFNESNIAFLLKEVDGRNKYVGGHAELTRLIDQLEVVIEVYKRQDDQFLLLFNISDNVCDRAMEAKSSPIAMLVLPFWKKYTNIPMECPIEAGLYYVEDIDYNDLAVQHIPVPILSGHYKIDIKFRHKLDITGNSTVWLTVSEPSGDLKSN